MSRSRRVWMAFGVFAAVALGCEPPATHKRLYEAEFGTKPPTRILVERLPDAWEVRNGTERIVMPQEGEGVFRVPVFGGAWVGAWEGGWWSGFWVDSLRPNDYKVPLVMRPIAAAAPSPDRPVATSTWRTTEGTLHLRNRGDSAWGTISTPTGDYRYLAGTLRNNLLTISTFDGSHLFRFDALVDGDSLVDGTFLSGTHYRTSFRGARISSKMPAKWESSFQLPVDSVLSFVGVNTRGDTVRWSSEGLALRGKRGAVVDVMGTWCPNCMDETRLLASLASDYPELEFVSVAFERRDDEQALRRLAQFRREMNLSWEVVLGGRASKRDAAAAISALDTVHSFPTTLFWPAAGSGVPKVHKGFNGPATGQGYEVEVEVFRAELDRLSGRSENR